MKPLREQVVVVTGASSGIGRATALELGKRGATVVLAARDEAGLRSTAQEIEAAGGTAIVHIADVAEWPQVQALAEAAVARAGRIDTWINNAAVATYGTFEQLTIEEIERVLRVDLLGSMFGTKAALAHMKRQGAGTIITVASVLGERSVPLMSTYCTAKRGLIGFVESLRLELEREASPIKLTLVVPASIDTPFYEHARSKPGVRARPVPPVYGVDIAARALVFAAEHPRRRIYVGGAGKLLALLERISPRLADLYFLQSDRAVRHMLTAQPMAMPDNLFQPIATPARTVLDGRRRGSLYTRLFELHRGTYVLGGLLALGVLALGARSLHGR